MHQPDHSEQPASSCCISRHQNYLSRSKQGPEMLAMAQCLMKPGSSPHQQPAPVSTSKLHQHKLEHFFIPLLLTGTTIPAEHMTVCHTVKCPEWQCRDWRTPPVSFALSLFLHSAPPIPHSHACTCWTTLHRCPISAALLIHPHLYCRHHTNQL